MFAIENKMNIIFMESGQLVGLRLKANTKYFRMFYLD